LKLSERGERRRDAFRVSTFYFVFLDAGGREILCSISISGAAFMPLVQVTMLQGRSADQKRKIAQRITDTMVEEAGARREAIVVTFVEVSRESYASGGVLIADKT